MSQTESKKYSLDTSAMLQISKTYPIHLFPKVWEKIERAAEEGKLFVLDKVYNELSRKDDFTHNWIKSIKKKIVKVSGTIVESKAAEVVIAFPKIIDPDSEYEQADPYLIADALLEVSVIVTCEKPHQLPLQANRLKDKIPNVCDHFGIANIHTQVGGERVIIELFEALGFTDLG